MASLKERKASFYLDQGSAPNQLNYSTNFMSYKGTPIDNNQGAYDGLTVWEQIDDGVQFTATRKFLMAVPIGLFFMLYVIGLGLGDEKDITVKGLEAVKSSSRIYLEAYTSILTIGKEKLEEYYGKEVVIADREMVESESDVILADADKVDVSFLVVGDPYGATTHTDLVIRARELNIPVKVIHNASIMNAIGACGLQLYNFGQTISIVFFTETWRPDSFYDRVKENHQIGLHTLCLLDIKVKEQSIENMTRGRLIYEPPRYMTVNEAVEQLLEIEEKRDEGICKPDSLAIGCARIGTDTQKIVAGTLEELVNVDFGGPLHSLVLIGSRMHEMEAEFVKEYAYNLDTFNAIVKRDYVH
ncbi:diphthine synthase [Helicostylum pulchrum]|uniref:diphthine methyl ester synthase n=1 Tax=Helicostylum pulchrum TaxID=562976 RepID=A0ABP9Y3X0_9FUNG